MNRRHTDSNRFLSLSLIIAFSFSLTAGADSNTPDPAWRERSTGLFVSRPDVRLSREGAGIAGEVELKPGSGIAYELAIVPHASKPTGIDLSIQVDGCNLKSLDYSPDDSRFIVSATAVFGKDRLNLGWRKRTWQFFGHLWDGFPPHGIRLTYAWGCGAPVGSMFRITDEETIFVVAGKDDAGKRIESGRMTDADFRAAYGRPPNGPVTSLVVRLDRPSNEKGNVKLSFEVKPASSPL